MSKVQLNRIKAVLADRGKTNKELSQFLGKTEATVSRWCTNEVNPSMETLFEIANFLDVDVRELIVSNKQNVNK